MVYTFIRIKIFNVKTCFIFLCFSFILNGQNKNEAWVLAKMLNESSNAIEISGHPQVIKTVLGNVVSFNGVDDAFFLEEMPLKSLEEFTVEMIFNPSVDGVFEQRVVHMGEVSGDRMLLEIRAIDGHWYFDGFAASGENKLALIDEKLRHPLGQWYHVAFVVAKDSLSTYVNGKLELTAPFSFKPIETGESSVGVRLNRRSWFKGSIYKIKVSPKKLGQADFMSFKINK